MRLLTARRSRACSTGSPLSVPVGAVVGLRLERLVWRRYPAVTGAD